MVDAGEEAARSRCAAIERTWIDGAGEEWSVEVPPTVYPPREDSHLLDRALRRIAGEPGRMLEVGCGTGVASVSAALRGWSVEGCDVHPLAVAAARALASSRGVNDRTRFREGGPGGGSDADGWAGAGGFDVLCWNPPYLDPVPEGEERLGPFEEGALTDLDESGGWPEVLRNELEDSGILSEAGLVVMVHRVGSRSGTILAAWIEAGWSARPIARATFGDERLVAIALWRGWGRNEPMRIDRTATTMDELQETAAAGAMAIARIQEGGKGRRERTWSSREGDLTATWRILASDRPVATDSGAMQMQAGLAVADAIAAKAGIAPPLLAWSAASGLSDIGLGLKWPNDLLVHGVGKLGGILMHGRSLGSITTLDVGIGINGGGRMHGDERVAGLADLGLGGEATMLATSIAACLGGRLEDHRRLPQSDAMEMVRGWWSLASPRLATKGAPSESATGGRVVGIADDGALLVADGESVIALTELAEERVGDH